MARLKEVGEFAVDGKDGGAFYAMLLGGEEEEHEEFVKCDSVESAKRAAQRTLNKVVRTLTGGS